MSTKDFKIASHLITFFRSLLIMVQWLGSKPFTFFEKKKKTQERFRSNPNPRAAADDRKPG